MAISAFVNSVWSAKLLQPIRDTRAPFFYVGTREYEPDFTSARTVKFAQILDSSVSAPSDYTREADIGAPEFPDEVAREFTLTQEQKMHFAVDDLNELQTKPRLMDGMVEVQAQRVRYQKDHYAMQQFGNTVPLAHIKTVNNVMDNLGEFSDAGWGTFDQALAEIKLAMLDKGLFERGGKPFMIVPSLMQIALGRRLRKMGLDGGSPFGEMLLKDGGTEPGLKGMYDGFELYGTNRNGNFSQGNRRLWGSNQLRDEDGNYINYSTANALGGPLTSGTNKDRLNNRQQLVWVGSPAAFACADVLNNVEAYRPERYFADAIKALYLYDFWPIIPTYYWCIQVTASD